MSHIARDAKREQGEEVARVREQDSSRLKVDLVWYGYNVVEVLVNGKGAWRGSSGADISDLLMRLNELGYIELRSHDSLSEYVESVKSE